MSVVCRCSKKRLENFCFGYDQSGGGRRGCWVVHCCHIEVRLRLGLGKGVWDLLEGISSSLHILSLSYINLFSHTY